MQHFMRIMFQCAACKSAAQDCEITSGAHYKAYLHFILSMPLLLHYLKCLITTYSGLCR